MRLNLVLAGAVLALVLVWLLDGVFSDDTPPRITALVTNAIQTIKLRTPGAPTRLLERSGDGWRLSAPFAAPAEPSAVQQLLDLATQRSQQQLPAATIDAAKAGLDPPQATIVFNDTVVALGGVHPIDNLRYARVEDTVHLIKEPGPQVLGVLAADLVARRLLPAGAEITALALPKVRLTRREPDGWAVTPEVAERGTDAARRTIAAWQRSRALAVEATQPGAAGAAKPIITVATAAHGELEFELLAREPELALRRPDLGLTYHLAKNRAAPLLELRHPQPSALKARPDIPLAADDEQ